MGPPPRTAAPNPGVPDERARVADERYVHPRHGICRVIGRQERKVGDGMRTYVELQVDASPSGRAALTMLLPEDELMEHVRDVAADAAPEAPPSVIVEVEGPSSADVERIVEERLRELTESGGSLPGAGDGAPE